MTLTTKGEKPSLERRHQAAFDALAPSRTAMSAEARAPEIATGQNLGAWAQERNEVPVADPCADATGMSIRNVRHRGLRRLIERNDASGLPPDAVDKLRRMVTFLQDMENEQELSDVPRWRAHRLSGDRGGLWSMTVTANWRLTFRVDESTREIYDLNYEDYH